MRGCTAELHAVAERGGVVAALVEGRITEPDYALYLRNLLPAYQAMEQALRTGGSRLELRGLIQPALYRSDRIVADLENMVGADWTTALPLLPSGKAYAARITLVGGSPSLIAHCYTRSLGDLNGGQIIGRRLVQRFGATFPALAFLTFPDIGDLPTFIKAYRESMDRAGSLMANLAPIVAEAAIAFEMNIDLSQEVGAFHHAGNATAILSREPIKL
jgi:heme oxygenase (biliverdin-producing, ferredoxin)